MPHNLRIVDYGLGHPGSAHDANAFRGTRVFEEHETLLADDEWVWGDSAYPILPWLVPPFKRQRGASLNREQGSFNYFLSKVIFIFIFILHWVLFDI